MTGLFHAPSDPKTLRIIPMGGCGEFGMNLTAYLWQKKLFVIDCGVKFPDPIRLGTDAVLPDVSPYFTEAGGVYAYIITHGHEDHIGALPHVLKKWPAPVYATGWSAELLKMKLQRLGEDPDRYPVTIVQAGDHVRVDEFDVEFVHMNHSIPHTCALFIRTPALNVFHTGDFKFDDQPLLEAPADWTRLKAIGVEGVDLLLADSTNAEKAGLCPGEATVVGPLTAVLKAAPEAVLLSTFSSNLFRLKSIADACIAAGRRVFIAGTGLENTLGIAKTLDLYHFPESLRINEDQVGRFPRSKLVVLATGCQGEWRSAMARIAKQEFKAFRVKAGDTVVLSSRIIPGNEKALLTMFNEFQKAGARIITAREVPGIHVSGHAYQGDLNLLHDALKPRFFAPVHGAFGQLKANQGRGEAAGSISQLIETGDVLDARRDGIENVGKIEISLNYVDGDSGVVMSYETLRDRLRIGELGCALVTGVYDCGKKDWVVPVEVELTGLALPQSDDGAGWLRQVAGRVANEAAKLAQGKGAEGTNLDEGIRIFLRRQLFQVLKKKPVVLVKLHLI